AVVTDTLASGVVVSIDYSQPSVKGRTIGKNLEPLDGRVWRAGANEATVFEISKAVKIEGNELPAGKYALFMLSGPDEWAIIFNKTWDQWGAFSYKEGEDALRVKVKPAKAKEFTETLTYTISDDGTVSLWWGDWVISFGVK
ncbi:MAG: DUF2911 domain-containing protein, partial [Chitinophagaceae bacterium]